uniref:coiled-coil domain-containing protein n=1 Tax=Streptomyces triticisoli TaxID=2182797 RepID=UPI000DD665B6
MGSHRRLVPSSGFDRGSAVAGLLTAATTALGAVPAGSAVAAPHGDARAEVDRLHQEAEKATEAYNQAGERAGLLRDRVRDSQDRIARQQQRVNDLRESLGAVAGAQYRSGFDPFLALLFSHDPADYLDRAAALDRISAHQAGELKDLRRTLREISQERAEATRALAELDRSRRAAATHKRTVERKLAEARRLLDSLSPSEREAHDRASRSRRDGLLPGFDDGPAASARAAAAVAAARSALGRPYVW